MLIFKNNGLGLFDENAMPISVTLVENSINQCGLAAFQPAVQS